MNHKIIQVFSALGLSALLLTGCGTSPGDRGLSGGLLGAGTGAAIGLLTSPDAINLGPAPWNRSASYPSHRKRHASRYARSNCSTRETATQRITTCAKSTRTARAY